MWTNTSQMQGVSEGPFRSTCEAYEDKDPSAKFNTISIFQYPTTEFVVTLMGPNASKIADILKENKIEVMALDTAMYLRTKSMSIIHDFIKFVGQEDTSPETSAMLEKLKTAVNTHAITEVSQSQTTRIRRYVHQYHQRQPQPPQVVPSVLTPRSTTPQ